MILFGLMGFGKPLDQTPPMLEPGTLATAFGGVVRQLAAGLGVELDTVEESYERLAAPDTLGEPSAWPSLQNVSEHCCHEPLDGCRARRTGLAVCEQEMASPDQGERE